MEPPTPPGEEEKRNSSDDKLGSWAAPWLVIPNGKDQTFYNLSEPNNKIYTKSIPELSRTSYRQSMSHQGWLVIICNYPYYYYYTSTWKYGDCFLWNPETFETIQLPHILNMLPIQGQSSAYYGFRGFVLSSNPMDSVSMVYFISGKIDNLVFCRPRKDKQWRTHKLPIDDKDSISSLFCFRGKLHIPCHNGLHLVIEPKLDHEDNVRLEVKSFHVSNEKENFTLGVKLIDYVESSDELFKVIRYFKYHNNNEVVDFKVFKMMMDDLFLEWEEIYSLGDHVLFLGELTTASCSSTKLGLTKGCIYYTQCAYNMLYKFDLDYQRISVSLPGSDLTTPFSKPEWISMPSNFRVYEDAVSIIPYDVSSKKNNGGELEQRGVCSILNENVIDIITSYLDPIDYLHLRAVCKESRSTLPADNWRLSSIGIVLPPWLVFSRKNDTIYNFIDPTRNDDRFLIDISEFLLDSMIRFSKGGWLLMSRGHKSIFFFNPFTKDIIHLPELPVKLFGLYVGMSFSSPPTSSDCEVFVIDTDYGVSISIFFISRRDNAWRHRNIDYTRGSSILRAWCFFVTGNSPIFYDGKIYCFGRHGDVGVFCPEDFSWNVLTPQRPCSSVYRSYLVECEGELLSVFIGNFGKWVQVFSLDLENNVWLEVKSLHKNMLFLSKTSCVSAIAPNTCMENKIYLPRFLDEKIMFFSLDTDTYHFVGAQHSAKDFNNTEEQLYCTWVEPSWSKSTVQELNWLSN